MDDRRMDIDLASNVKSLSMGITQYQSNKSESNMSHVLRHIEVLLGGLTLSEITRLFNPRSVLGSDCISCMIKILVDPNTDSHILSKSVELLNALSRVSDVRDHLQHSFSMAAILCSYIVQNASHENYSHITPQILVLLSRVTYRKQVSSSIAQLNRILEYLLQELENGENDTILPALRVLNNLVSSNLSIQVNIKSMLNSKRTRNLMQFLKQGATQQSILSLSILTAIFWGDEIGKKLYHGQNWFKAMKIIFSTLFDSSNLDAQSTAADLCIELLKHSEISQQIVMYEEEHTCTVRLVELLNSQTEASSKILEVILAFCHVGLVRSNLCQRVFKENMRCWSILLNVAASNRNYFALPVEKSPALLALDLIKELCEEVVESAKEPTHEWSNDLFSMINSHLGLKLPDEQAQLKVHLHKILKTAEIILCLSSEDDLLLKKAGEKVKYNQLELILEHQLTHNLTGIVTIQPVWSEIGIDTVFAILELMLRIKHMVPALEKTLFKVLQDIRMVPFFVSALSSTKSSRVQCALRLQQEASSLPDFPFVLLGEKIAELNSKRQGHVDDLSPRIPLSDTFSLTDLKAPTGFDRPDAVWNDIKPQNVLEGISVASVCSSSSSEDKENLDSIINKMQGRMKVDKKLSGKTAQIMEMYEQKIASLQTKESHLQDLLDAKALALAQADRVISRNRCQQVQLEEESRRLAHLLQESETKCDHLLQEVQNAELSRQEVEKELESSVEENRNLQKIAEQYDCLQVAFNDKKHRIEVQERNLAAFAQEYDTLKEMHDMFQKHNEKLKTQVNEGVRRLEQLEEERLKLLKEAGDKQMQIHELEGLVMESEKVARQLLDEKSELEVTTKNLKSTIQNLEEDSKNQKIKLSSQERAKQQLEHQLEEKGVEIKKLHQRNKTHEKKISGLYAEKQALEEEVSMKKNEIKKLQDKLEEQKETFLKITQLSAALQNSQS